MGAAREYFRRLIGLVQHFRAEEAGSGTVFGLFVFIAMAIVCGLAIDVSHAYSERTRLQVAADVAGHAALYNRRTMPADAAKVAAIDVVKETMPHSSFGDFIRPSDFEFGTYDFTRRSFVADAASRKSVRVNTARLRTRDNPVVSFVSQIIGRDSWDVRTSSVFTAFLPPCFREGFIAEGPVMVNSNNLYQNGFCIHSNTRSSINNNNLFEPGTVVSMPNLDLLKIPASGFAKNTGLAAALKTEKQDIREVRYLTDIISNLSKPGSPHYPSFITTSIVINLMKDKYTPLDLLPGRIYRIGCSGATATIDKTAVQPVLRDVVILTTCDVKIGAGLALENAVIATTSTATKAITGPSSFRLGRIDDCLPDGGAQLLTLGGVSFTSSLEIYGGQIITRGDVTFSSNAFGKGVSVIAGGTINGTSNMEMTACDERGMERNFHIDHYRLAE